MSVVFIMKIFDGNQVCYIHLWTLMITFLMCHYEKYAEEWDGMHLEWDTLT